VTSRPCPASWLGTIRSTAVFANTAAASRGPAAVSHCADTSDFRMSVALMAFSHAITCSGASPAALAAIPLAITGATNLRICGPTAVVTTSAVAISAMTSASWLPELSARKFSTVRTVGCSPTSWTR